MALLQRCCLPSFLLSSHTASRPQTSPSPRSFSQPLWTGLVSLSCPVPQYSACQCDDTYHTQLKSLFHKTISSRKHSFQNIAGAQKCLWNEQTNEGMNEWKDVWGKHCECRNGRYGKVLKDKRKVSHLMKEVGMMGQWTERGTSRRSCFWWT